MKVYVSSELSQISDGLKKKGYNVISEKEDIFDAIICDLKDGGLNKLNMSNTIKFGKTIIIDVAGKNIEDIDNILYSKSYNNMINKITYSP
ncbi:YkuS family protein [Clostridium tyrobutyricum]|uniref:YkuS family protein n=1 Tax=Clostridium tyrobutyricum TaxID=1519 RepID=UPI00241E9D48|nr:YkuS family protein [Clostridium tyrobutyricum]